MDMNMPNPTTPVRDLGPIFQLAYMASDFEDAIKRWIALGAGPFYVLPGLVMDNIEYQGERHDIDIDIAFGFWGDIQIEVIRQNNDAPSIYREWQLQKKQEIHHIGVRVPDMGAARARLEANGYGIVYEKAKEGHGEFVYGQSADAPCLIELVKQAPGAFAACERQRAEAASWDGSRPIRPFSELMAV